MERMASSEQGGIVPGLMWRDENGNSGPIRKTDIPLEDRNNPGNYKVKIDGEMKDVVRVAPDEPDSRSSKNTVSNDVYADIAETKLSAALDEGLPKLNGVFDGKSDSSLGETTMEIGAVVTDADETYLDFGDDSNGEHLNLDTPEGGTKYEDDDGTPEEETAKRRKRSVGAVALAFATGAGVGLAGLYGVSVAGTSHVTEGTISPSVKDFVIDLIPGNDK